MCEYEKGIISKIYGSFYQVFLLESQKYQLTQLKGKLREIYKIQKERHPFVIGDIVFVEKKASQSLIFTREERKNYLVRMDRFGDKQVLCSNLDQILIVTSLTQPETKFGFIDRCLAAVSVTNIKPILLFNKADLISNVEAEKKLDIYKNLGIQTILFSCVKGYKIDKICKILKDKTTYLVGNSGVGKSKLINLICGEEIQKVAEISKSGKKGRHTTTNSFAIFLDSETIVIDSPGVKEWGVLHLKRSQILKSFVELKEKISEWEEKGYLISKDFFLYSQDIKENLRQKRYESFQSMIKSLDRSYRTTRRQLLKDKEL